MNLVVKTDWSSTDVHVKLPESMDIKFPDFLEVGIAMKFGG